MELFELEPLYVVATGFYWCISPKLSLLHLESRAFGNLKGMCQGIIAFADLKSLELLKAAISDGCRSSRNPDAPQVKPLLLLLIFGLHKYYREWWAPCRYWLLAPKSQYQHGAYWLLGGEKTLKALVSSFLQLETSREVERKKKGSLRWHHYWRKIYLFFAGPVPYALPWDIYWFFS